jgi:PIN domain nuclease of toxin-antitoxin system
MPVVTAIAAWNLRYEIENGKLKMENCLQRHSMPVVTANAAWNLRYEIENGKLKMKNCL